MKNEKHLKWLRTLPCCVTGKVGNVVAAHIRKGSGAGMGQKPDDNLTVPLNYWEHSKQHNEGELTYWAGWSGVVKAKQLARDLYKISGNDLAAYRLLRNFRSEINGET